MKDYIVVSQVVAAVLALIAVLGVASIGGVLIDGPCDPATDNQKPTKMTFGLTARIDLEATIACNEEKRWRVTSCAAGEAGGKRTIWEPQESMARMKNIGGANVNCLADRRPAIARERGSWGDIMNPCTKVEFDAGKDKETVENPISGLKVQVILKCDRLSGGPGYAWYVRACKINGGAEFMPGNVGTHDGTTLKCQRRMAPTYDER